MITASENQQKVKELIQIALDNPKQSTILLENPAEYFQNGGVDIPIEDASEFNRFFHESAQGLAEYLSLLIKSGQPSAQLQDKMVDASWLTCVPCCLVAFSVATAIIAVGVVGLADLTVGSAAVIALAGFAGVSTEAALAFIGTLGSILTSGPTTVTEAICEWMGLCG